MEKETLKSSEKVFFFESWKLRFGRKNGEFLSLLAMKWTKSGRIKKTWRKPETKSLLGIRKKQTTFCPQNLILNTGLSADKNRAVRYNFILIQSITRLASSTRNGIVF